MQHAYADILEHVVGYFFVERNISKVIALDWQTHKLTNQPTNWTKPIEISPSWEVDLSDAQKFSNILLNRSFITVFTRSRLSPYPEPDSSNPLHPIVFNIYSNVISRLILSFRKVPFLQDFVPKTCINFSCLPYVRATCPANFVLLDLITLIIFR
jgi:hypothetical protein